MGGSFAVLAASPGPDEAERFLAAFDDGVVEKVGVDGLGEARIVQLEAQIIAVLVRALGPGGADFGAADEDPVGGGVLAIGAVLGNNADVLRLHVEGDDFSDILVAGLLEGSDGCHVNSPIGFRSRARRGLDGDRQDRDDPPTQPLARSASGGRRGRTFLDP